MVFFKKIVSKHYNMTTTPKKRLIILILGITTHLNLGNIPTAYATQAASICKKTFLHHSCFSNLSSVDIVQTNSYLEEKLHVENYFIAKEATEIGFLFKTTIINLKRYFKTSNLSKKKNAFNFNYPKI